MNTADREKEVLSALIQLYVDRREPISSRMIEEEAELGVRSATIRSVLLELEKKGYLVQPHRSSGRLPTDDGYRAYVDSVLDEASLGDLERRRIDRALREAGEDLEEILRVMARVLGQLSNNIAILAGPRELNPTVTGVDIYARDSSKAMVVVTLGSKGVRTQLVDLERPLTQESLTAASTFLAERLGGRTVDEIRSDIDSLLRPTVTEVPGVAVDVASQASRLFDSDGMLSLTFEGVAEAVEQPEFRDPTRLKALLEVISKAHDFERALQSFVGPQSGEVSLAIGAENALPVLHPFSLLATRFDLNDQYGYLAILGPRRMRYARTVALIRLIANHLEELRH